MSFEDYSKTKKCRICGIEKNLNEFYKYRRICKSCLWNSRKKWMHEYSKKYNKEISKITKKERQKLLKDFGNKCVICGSTSGLLKFHEIHGKSHPYLVEYIKEHKNDFVLLCILHHRFIHYLAKHGNWEMFKNLVEKLKS